MTRIQIGSWRDDAKGPMQVVSGPIGRERVHYLTTSKWSKIAKCSQDTALRDIDDPVKRGVLVKGASGGRSTSYSLVEV